MRLIDVLPWARALLLVVGNRLRLINHLPQVGEAQ